MPLHRKLIVGPEQEWAIKDAGGCRCEVCNARHPASRLEIHLIRLEENNTHHPHPNPERNILILCQMCHRNLHRLPSTRAIDFQQRKLLRDRPKKVRRRIQTILGYNPKSYTPPETDLAELYEELQRRCGGLQGL